MSQTVQIELTLEEVKAMTIEVDNEWSNPPGDLDLPKQFMGRTISLVNVPERVVNQLREFVAPGSTKLAEPTEFDAVALTGITEGELRWFIEGSISGNHGTTYSKSDYSSIQSRILSQLAQLTPPLAEPTEFGAMVEATSKYHTKPMRFVRKSSTEAYPWYCEDERYCLVFSDFINPKLVSK
jgi:hypothetical protein